MATWADVRAAALRLPEMEEKSGDFLSWRVRDKLVAWERPLRKSDLAALGPSAPTGDLVAFRTADLAEKDEVIAARPDVFFTIPHFDGYPAVLAHLDRLDPDVLDAMMLAAWRDRAPKKLVKGYKAR